MKKACLISALAIYSSSVHAANPGTICVASNKYHILIEPTQKRVRVSEWSKIVDTFTILGTQVRSIETMPPVWQTTYKLEDGYNIVVEYRSGEESGSAYATKDGKTVAEYRTCYESKNIKR
jgi:hypothetical protein